MFLGRKNSNLSARNSSYSPMKYSFALTAASLAMLVACSGFIESDFDNSTPLEEEELVERIIFEAPVIRSLGEDGETRVSFSQESNNEIVFAWEAEDTVGIYPDKGSQVFFEMKDGVGTNIATFDGGGWSLRKESTYSCYFPFVGNAYLKRDAIPVSFANQEQAGISNYENSRFFIASEGTSSSEGALHFKFFMLNTIIRIKAIGLPAGTYTKLTLTTDEPEFVQDGYFGLDNMSITGKTKSNSLEITLKNFTLTEASSDENPVLIYMSSAPIDLSGKPVTIRVYSDDNSVFMCERTPGIAYEANRWGGLRCEMVKDSPVGSMENPNDSGNEVVI